MKAINHYTTMHHNARRPVNAARTRAMTNAARMANAAKLFPPAIAHRYAARAAAVRAHADAMPPRPHYKHYLHVIPAAADARARKLYQLASLAAYLALRARASGRNKAVVSVRYDANLDKKRRAAADKQHDAAPALTTAFQYNLAVQARRVMLACRYGAGMPDDVPHDVADLISVALVALMERLPADSARPCICGRMDTHAAILACRRELYRLVKHSAESTDDNILPRIAGYALDAEFRRAEELQDFETAMHHARIPDIVRAALRLLVNGKTSDDAAAIVGLSGGTVRHYKHILQDAIRKQDALERARNGRNVKPALPDNRRI